MSSRQTGFDFADAHMHAMADDLIRRVFGPDEDENGDTPPTIVTRENLNTLQIQVSIIVATMVCENEKANGTLKETAKKIVQAIEKQVDNAHRAAQVARGVPMSWADVRREAITILRGLVGVLDAKDNTTDTAVKNFETVPSLFGNEVPVAQAIEDATTMDDEKQPTEAEILQALNFGRTI